MTWRIHWQASLTPDLAMIPDRSVFSISNQQLSLTATVEGIPALLISSSEPLLPDDRRETTEKIRQELLPDPDITHRPCPDNRTIELEDNLAHRETCLEQPEWLNTLYALHTAQGIPLLDV
ncbi:MAG TPA: hypothetical protein VL461_00120 [Dictyobacter sp.]|nr:hypothetical protein [Dictyobacter sp.]